MLVKKDLTWKLYSATTKPAGLFISKDWCDENMFEKPTSSDEDPTVKSKYENCSSSDRASREYNV
jgi:hypothetical protein